MSAIFEPNLRTTYKLKAIDSWPDALHRFDPESMWAVRAALAARRPLLLRGEPGIGKSQLARAVAHVEKVPFLYHVIDERSERDDLLYHYDAVSRLGQAQMAETLQSQTNLNWEDAIAEKRFIRPGVLWWAFNWASAEAQTRQYFRDCKRPVKPKGWSQITPDSEEPRLASSVVLIDEIDKADPAVPNGLLESLGNAGFQTTQLGKSVALAEGAAPPLVIITTNEERELPAAFLRRCLVYRMQFPPPKMTSEEFLMKRARIYWSEQCISNKVCRQIITDLLEDRKEAKKLGLSRPGAAEFLDILNILGKLYPDKDSEQSDILEKIRDFALKKHVSEEEEL